VGEPGAQLAQRQRQARLQLDLALPFGRSGRYGMSLLCRRRSRAGKTAGGQNDRHEQEDRKAKHRASFHRRGDRRNGAEHSIIAGR